MVSAPRSRDAFWFGFYTGMRLNEVLTLRWECVGREAMVLRVADRIDQLMRTAETQTP